MFFSQFVIDPGQVFLLTPLVMGFVNVRPAVPGHVLLSPRRVTLRLKDLTAAELTELILCSHRAARALEELHGVSSLSITIQDGPLAGQTVPHLHMHLLPRRAGDFGHNDQVYDAIDRSSSPLPGAARTLDDMRAEADALRQILNTIDLPL